MNAFTGAAPAKPAPPAAFNWPFDQRLLRGCGAGNHSCGPDQDDGSCVFQQQSDYAFGTLRPGSLRAPSFQNIDMSVAKTFRVWHEQRLDFRADFFNTFNIASYQQPGFLARPTLTFGQITGVNSSPRTIQLSLKYAF